MYALKSASYRPSQPTPAPLDIIGGWRRIGVPRHKVPPWNGAAAGPPIVYRYRPGLWAITKFVSSSHTVRPLALGESPMSISGTQPTELVLPTQYSSGRGHGGPQVNVWALMNTAESRMWSPASAIASLMWFVPDRTDVNTVSTVVRPSSSMLTKGKHGKPPPPTRSRS